jgi:hypothetical protein
MAPGDRSRRQPLLATSPSGSPRHSGTTGPWKRSSPKRKQQPDALALPISRWVGTRRWSILLRQNDLKTPVGCVPGGAFAFWGHCRQWGRHFIGGDVPRALRVVVDPSRPSSARRGISVRAAGTEHPRRDPIGPSNHSRRSEAARGAVFKVERSQTGERTHPDLERQLPPRSSPEAAPTPVYCSRLFLRSPKTS